jgi:hypothetical protein
MYGAEWGVDRQGRGRGVGIRLEEETITNVNN